MSELVAPDADPKNLHAAAYAAMARGELANAAQLFGQLVEACPDAPHYHYMRGLAHKYLRDWPASLRDNLAAIATAEESSQAEHWNAAIAATALGDWATARAQWRACGVGVPEGEGAIDGNYGVAVVRLTPWHGGETVWMRRIDPARARLLNVPLPESGHRFGDIVLHDGASTGTRWDGERQVPVFNELQRLHASDFATHVVFVHSPSAGDLDALRDASLPGIGYVEDWTDSIRHYCLRCSYGAPHDHAEADEGDEAWNPDRNLGIAAQGRAAVEKLLADWASRPGCRIEAIEVPTQAIPESEDGHVWWREPEDEDDAEDAGSSA